MNQKLIIIGIIAAICISFCAGYFAHQEKQCEPQWITQNAVDDLKADSYTAGMIDGRASVYFEEEGTVHTDLGVPSGYSPELRTPQWRAYANCIAYNNTAACHSLDDKRLDDIQYHQEWIMTHMLMERSLNKLAEES